jgi:hypothetical protein
MVSSFIFFSLGEMAVARIANSPDTHGNWRFWSWLAFLRRSLRGRTCHAIGLKFAVSRRLERQRMKPQAKIIVAPAGAHLRRSCNGYFDV